MKKRIDYWDNLKCLLIILVVVGHFIEPMVSKSIEAKRLWLFIYTFHMPLFIFIAGYFHRNTKIAEKMYMYIALGIVTRILIFLPNLLWGITTNLSIFYEGGIPWFMFVMALYIGTSFLLRNLSGKLVLTISVIIALFVGYDKSINDFLVLSRYFVFFPFYWAGILLQNSNIMEFMKNFKWHVIIGFIIIGGVLYLCIFHLGDFYHLRPYFTGRNPYSWHKEAGAIIRLIAYIIASGMCFAVLSLCPFRNLPLLTRIGSRSLQIYFWHQLFRNIIVHYGLLKYLSSPSSKVIYVLLAILLALILGTRPFGFPVTMIRKLCLNK